MLRLELGLYKPVFLGNPVEGDLRRVPADPGDILVSVRESIVTEGQRLQEMVESPEFGVIALEQRPVGVNLLDGHAVQVRVPVLSEQM